MRGSGSGVSKAVCFMVRIKSALEVNAAKIVNYSDIRVINHLRTANRSLARRLGTGLDALILKGLECIL